MLANINRDTRARREPFKPSEFMNFIESPPEKKLTPVEIERELDAIF